MERAVLTCSTSGGRRPGARSPGRGGGTGEGTGRGGRPAELCTLAELPV